MKRREALSNTLLTMGYAISVPSLIAILNSCNSDSSQTWQPEFFLPEQANVISELAETILPKTPTPGAKDLHIDQFIDRMINQLFSANDQQLFLKGMDVFEAEAKRMNGKSFIDSSTEERSRLLTKLEQETEKVPARIWGITMKKDAGPLPFYRKVKELTLLGYFTSMEIGKEVLVYDPVPGTFTGDIPLGQQHISFE